MIASCETAAPAGTGTAPKHNRESPHFTPDYRAAEEFLQALDPAADSWTFQTFPDAGNDRTQIRQLHGTLADHAAALGKLNERGAGIFVTINQTDGRGRKKANITRIRALFVDLDGAPLLPTLTADHPPHITVESSPGRWHCYWRVADCPLDSCEPALKKLIGRYGADAACCDRSRVLRLPGFLHRKREPAFMVRMLSATPGEYPLGALGIPDLQKNPQSSSVLFCRCVSGDLTPFLPDAVGQRNRKLFDLARALKGQHPDSVAADHRQTVEEWHRLALPVIGTVDFLASWTDFTRGWQAIRCPTGAVLAEIMEKATMTDEIPEQLKSLGYGPQAWRLVQICRELQQAAGDGPFFLGGRKAGELIDMHFTDAGKVLAALVADGVLELVKRGAGAVASRYRFLGYESRAARICPD